MRGSRARPFTYAVSVLTLFIFYVDRSNLLLNYTLSHFGTLPPGNYPRVASTFLNANMLCNYLNVSIVFVLAAYKLGWLGDKLFYLLLVLIAVAIALTISPGIGGVLLSIGLWVWAQYRERGLSRAARMSLAMGTAAAVLFFVFILVAPTPNSLAEFKFEPVAGGHIYSSERVSAWFAAARTFAANPILGAGLGLDSGIASSIAPNGEVHTISDAHQIWLNFAAQTGIVGLSVMVVLVVYIVTSFWPLKFERDHGSILKVAGACAFIGAFLYQGLSGSFEDARHLWVLMGFIVAVAH